MMNEYEITSTKMEYTGKAYKFTITFLFNGERHSVTGFSDMMTFAEMYAEDAMRRIVYQ
jgi:hypothetical protein